MTVEEVARDIDRAEQWAMENEPVLACLSREERRRLLMWGWLYNRRHPLTWERDDDH